MNFADSEEMSAAFLEKGVVLTEDRADADILILNTCTVRQHAEDKALSYIGRLKPWKKANPERVLIVAGCAAERLKKTLKRRFPHVDLVVGAKSMDEFPQVIESFFRSRKTSPWGQVLAIKAQRPDPMGYFEWFHESEESFGQGLAREAGEPLVLGEEGKTAFVTIMRGCNYSCSYCIVPSVRGREKYRDPKSILSEVREKAAGGASKVMLLGQTVNSYWFRGPGEKIADFAYLVTAVNLIPEVSEIRFMSPHPHYMSDKLIRALSKSEKVSPQIHLPVQSGSNRVLTAMKRNYTREDYLEIVEKLGIAIPNLRLSTDFIVGFPGETDQDFELTLSLASMLPLGMAYCFKYSVRDGTEAARQKDDVPRPLKESRLSILLKTIETITAKPKEALLT